MLKIGNKPKTDKEPASDKIMEPKPVEPTPNVEAKEEKTIIGNHISIEGNIRGEENLVIKGSMKGNIEMENHTFEVGSNGRFEGEIHAQNVKISGKMVGNIKTPGKVEITKEANFVGEIKARTISVVEGAYIKGAIELDREPLKNASLAKEPKAISIPQPVREPGSQVEKMTNK